MEIEVFITKKSTWNRVIAGIAFAIAFSTILLPLQTQATDYRPAEVRVFELKKQATTTLQQDSFFAFDASYEKGGSVAVCDVNNDNQDEIIVGAGQQAQSEVKVFSSTGIQLSSFLAFPEQVNTGVNVACGNLDAQGAEEIVLSAGKGGGPMVNIFNMNGEKQFTQGFFAFDEEFRGGAFVAVGNIDGKKGQEIIVGAGPGGGPHVRVFDRFGNYLGIDFSPFASTYHGGVSVSTANVDGGPATEILMAQHSFGGLVKVYRTDSTKSILGEFRPYGEEYAGGINVTGAGDIDRDGVEELATAPRQGGGPHVRFFEGHGEIVSNGLSVYESEFRGGVSVAAGNVDSDSKQELVTLPQKKFVEGRTDWEKYIDVNLTTQTLTAYEMGVKQMQFFISSGVSKYPTPEDITTITAKIPLKDYEWSYGPNHPDNYDIKSVRNNLRFRPRYYIHEAFWHNNFGHPMSHGCINVSPENAQHIYDWASVGTIVWVHQ